MKQYIVEMQGMKYYYNESRTRYIIVTASSEDAAKIHAGAKLWDVYREYVKSYVSVCEYNFNL